jgi:hypothetical protein
VIVESISRHLTDSIWPDRDVIDQANRTAAINWVILFDLAKRAERHGDPYENLDATYRAVEVDWESGRYHDFMKQHSEGQT